MALDKNILNTSKTHFIDIIKNQSDSLDEILNNST